MALINLPPRNTPTPPATLIDQGNCNKCISTGLQVPAMIALLQQINESNYTTAELEELAKCYSKCIPVGMYWPVVIYLLDQIVQGLE